MVHTRIRTIEWYLIIMGPLITILLVLGSNKRTTITSTETDLQGTSKTLYCPPSSYISAVVACSNSCIRTKLAWYNSRCIRTHYSCSNFNHSGCNANKLHVMILLLPWVQNAPALGSYQFQFITKVRVQASTSCQML